MPCIDSSRRDPAFASSCRKRFSAIRSASILLWTSACLAAIPHFALGGQLSPIGPQPVEQPGYAPDELLILLTAESADAAAYETAAGRGAAHFTDQLKLPIESARPVIRLSPAGSRGVVSAFHDRVWAMLEKYPNRSKRSPALRQAALTPRGAGGPSAIANRDAVISRAPESVQSGALARMFRVTLADGSADPMAICEQIKQIPGVEAATPNYRLRLFSNPLPDVEYIPNDPFVADGVNWREDSWGRNRPDLYGHRFLQALEAYDLFSDPQNGPGAGVVVAVIDTGADFLHADLAANIWTHPGEDLNGNGQVDASDFDGVDSDGNGFVDDIRGWDFTNYVYPTQPDNEPLDFDGHGSHCSGTIAAVGNNGIGTLGIAPNAKIMPLCIAFTEGQIGVAESLEAVLYAAENGADVTSNSWGGPNFGAAPFLEFVFEYAHALGCVNVAAAGNAAVDVSTIAPASYESVIAVSATDYFDLPTFFTDFGEKIDVGAPGYDVLSIRATGTDLYTVIFSPFYQPGERFAPPYDETAINFRSDGTSMAGPHVAGVAALVLSANPNLGVEEVREVIRRAADDLGDPGEDDYFGAGRANAFRAVELALRWPDCNDNGVTDADDVASGFSDDTNGDGLPDECQDCDADGFFDPDEIDSGAEQDCNANQVPDACDLSAQNSPDCNFNLTPDECDIASGLWADCDADQVPDFCEVYFYGKDCNANLIPDNCDLANGVSLDINVNYLPDECDPDCNSNGLPDDLDIESGAADCNANGIPDECDSDCNGNAIPDACDLANGTSLDCDANLKPDECDTDCNENGLPDACDLAAETSVDCSGNRVPDECEEFFDCNANGVFDDCDIASFTSADCNNNDVPDECDLVSGEADDCNLDAIPDSCQSDCNENGVPDDCDIDNGTSADCTADRVPDECEDDCNENGIADSCDLANDLETDCNLTAAPDACEPYFDFTDLSADTGLLIGGASRYDRAGTSVQSAGDVNGDGFPDLIVGAWRAEYDDAAVGAAYVVFGGQPSDDTSVIELAGLDGANGFAFYGDFDYDDVGQSVAGGDFNGDGFADVLIGAPRSSPTDGGRTGGAYLIFGGSAAGETGLLRPGDLDGTIGLAIAGNQVNSLTGYSVANLGDVNNDGLDDLGIGAYWSYADDPYSGEAYVIFGQSKWSAEPLMLLEELQSGAGFAIRGGASGDGLGFAVNGVGDINSDGNDDFAVGAYQSGIGGLNAGAVHVLFGGPTLEDLTLFDVNGLDGTNGFAFIGAEGDWTGSDLAGAGDVNGDGIDDLLIGNDPYTELTAAYVIFGSAGIGESGVVYSDELLGGGGLHLTLDRPAALRVAGRSDLNGDAIVDVLLADRAFAFDESTPGGAHVVYGSPELTEFDAIDLALLAPPVGRSLLGASGGDAFGSSVAGGFDWNGDGFLDFLVGADQDDFDFTLSGSAYVYYAFNDCNGNGLFDECELDDAPYADLNQNGVLDDCEDLCDGDVNLDGLVDPLDSGAILSRLGQPVTDENEIYDANRDGLIDPLDIGYVASRFGSCG